MPRDVQMENKPPTILSDTDPPLPPTPALDGARGALSGGRGSPLSPQASPARVHGHHLTSDDEEDPNEHLEEEGDADEHDEGSIVLEGGSLLQHSLELGDVGHEEGHVQHALGHALLGGVVVDVHGPVDPQVRSHTLGRQEEPQALLSQHTHLSPVGC